MRILLLADAYVDDLPGESQVVANELAAQLVQFGHEATLLVSGKNDPAPSGTLTDRGVRVVRYGGAGQALEYLSNGRLACKRLWDEHPYDIVHTHFTYAAVGPLKVIPAQVPRIRTFHGPWDDEVRGHEKRAGQSTARKMKAWSKVRLARAIEMANLRSSDRIITLSKAFRAILSSNFRIPASSVDIVSGGVDANRFCPGDTASQREKLGLPKDRRILLSIRRLAPRVGLDNLIRAMPAIVRHSPDVFLAIGGGGSEREILQDLIDSLDLQSHVKLVGLIADSDLPSYYQAADLFVAPATGLDGFGLAIVEALACGTPVVGSPAGATPEILEGLSPRLIARGPDPASLAAAIDSCLNDDVARELTPDILRNYVLRRFTWARHAAAMQEIYRQEIEKRLAGVRRLASS